MRQKTAALLNSSLEFKMLNNFKSIYNRELKRNFYTEFEREMLGSKHFRMFVYEVCKDCLKKELAEILHSCGISAFQHPIDRSADSWNDYREKIASELLLRCEINLQQKDTAGICGYIDDCGAFIQRGGSACAICSLNR